MLLITEREWFIEVPWGKLCVVAWGDCYNRPVLLCHSELDTAAAFRPLVNLLPHKFYYIAMEFPGCGRSDPLPPGLPLNAHDMAYAITAVVKHYRWTEFTCIAHSIGALYAKIYNLSNPGKVTKLIELDPTPAYSDILRPEEFSQWYQKFFINFYKNYEKFNDARSHRKIYTKKEALEYILARRDLEKDKALPILERMTEPVGDCLRFTYDPRTDIVTRPASTHTLSKNLYTSIKTHTLAVLSELSVQNGAYDNAPFVLNSNTHKNGNYRCKIVKGNHEVHISNPELVAPYISHFLLNGLEDFDRRSKL